jgi:signal transduction histidine kinase/ActR/RegA family two-component response regulator
MAESESRFRFFFEQSPEGVWHFDLERPLEATLPEAEQLDHLYRHARITFCNPAMARMCGCEQAADLLGAGLADILPKDSPRGRHLTAFLRSGYRLTEAESHEVDRRGQPRYFLHTLIGQVESGLLESAWGTQLDITERRLLEEELKRGAAELLAADQQKDDFLATLAHELRNPLAPLWNAVFVVRNAAQSRALDPALEQASTVIERQVAKLARLVDDLLDVSRIRRGAIELRRERVALAAVIDGAVESSRPLIERRDHRLRVAQPPAPVHLDADATRLEQVIANLLNNAAKYTPPGGMIDLAVEVAGAQVVIAVRDTGIGFPPELTDRLFEPFVQGDLPAGSEGGLGIGLALARGLVELHGGEICARSAGPGQGSEFVVRLPVALPAPAPVERALPPEEAAPVPPLSVLIVEDDPDTALSLATLIELWGHQPRTAADGPAGLDAATAPGAPPPDVALLDLGLPGGMDGCDLARQLRAQLGPELLLIALTGYGQEEVRRRAREAGFDRHFVKPVSPLALRHLLAQRAQRAKRPT